MFYGAFSEPCISAQPCWYLNQYFYEVGESIDLVYVKVKCSGVLVLKVNKPFCCDEIKFEKKNCNNFMK